MKVLYLHCHDMGRFNSIYGYNINTPNILSVAKDSTVFRNAHCACPTCSPSRGALLTGMYPHNNGLIGLAHRGFSITDKSMHLANFLKSNGYYTVLCGVQHETINNTEKELGYVDVYPRHNFTDNKDAEVANTAARIIKENANLENMFISCGFTAPHRPYVKHNHTNPDYVAVPSCIPDNAETREDFADYMETVEKMDECAGTVIAALKEANIYDETLILLTTDHGIAFPFMKCNLYDVGTGITMAIKLPHQKENKVTDALCSHIDVFPTLCDILGLKKPDYLQGTSLVPILNGDKKEVRDEVFFEVTYHAAYEPKRAIRTKHYALIKRFDKEISTVVLPNIDDGYSKSYLLGNGLKDLKTFYTELYDLDNDPNERNNLANDPDYKNIKENLESRLHKFMVETNDPLLAGYVPKPKGAIVNIKTCISPNEKDYE